MNENSWTIRTCLEWTEQRLRQNQEENPRLSAQWLLAHATGLERIELYMNFDQPLTDDQRVVLREAITRRLQHEPLQYIVGHAAFRYLQMMVRPGVLIPRVETELLVDLAKASSPKRVLDVGTGTGAIALALLHELPECFVVATDISEDAIRLAMENAERLGVAVLSRLEVIQDDLATSLLDRADMPGSFDVVVSNPPYIPSVELESLPDEVKRYEPRSALDGGVDGLDLFKRLLDQATQLLKPGGKLLVELHENRVSEAAQLAKAAGYKSVSTHTDLAGRARFLFAELPAWHLE
ncbi:MAG: peptide chain release factor N(5)-glutamine methyltransferase [Coriobacteriia bacterium]|nr:peptide chain release factor N(5)-glutamine methyltransferase [Coriobacteriia bacterium]